MATKPLVVIVGPTASGKTGLAIKIAKRFNGEVIAADSRTIYKYMNIGTAKPTAREMDGVAHWGLDLVEPGESFSAADFKDYALKKIDEIRDRGHLPILVGGSGLYVDAVIFDYQFGNKADPEKREQLLTMSIDELIDYCKKHNVALPENTQNKRYLVRAIEQQGINHQRRLTPIKNTIIVGIATDTEVLRSRIEKRADLMFKGGMIDEAKAVGERFGWQNEAMTGNIYRLVKQHFDSSLTVAELHNQFILSDWHLAKRQLTWLRRNKFIHWLSLDEAETYIVSRLASE
jgi:tRNA dimethylallyltransferase